MTTAAKIKLKPYYTLTDAAMIFGWKRAYAGVIVDTLGESCEPLGNAKILHLATMERIAGKLGKPWPPAEASSAMSA